MKTLEVQTLQQWRKWLAAHHDSESEVWLVFNKLHTGKESIAYTDALDEALCFGWVDSLVKRLSDDQFARKFTPRKPDSRWSDVNRKRYAQLAADGRLKAPGLARAPTDRTYDVRIRKEWKMPGYMEAALKKNPAAKRFFETLAPGYQRKYIGWIDSAKQEETKLRRLAEAIRLLEQGKKLGLK
jgi:uncharacterized protein YdeI (YjbR/CyaY-like superfamily)